MLDFSNACIICSLRDTPLSDRQSAMQPRLILPFQPAVRDSLDIAKLFVAAKMCGVAISKETDWKECKEGGFPRLELSE